MNDFKLKIIISVLGGVFFAFLMILLALALPVDKKTTIEETQKLKKPKSKLERVSKSIREE